MDLKARAKQLKTDLPAVFLALKRKETPWTAKVLAALTIRLIPAEVLASCRVEAEGLWKDGKPKRWYYAIPIVLLWLLILFLVVRALLQNKTA